MEKQLIVITPPGFSGVDEGKYEAEVAVCVRLFDAGLERLHLRKPEATADELGAWLHALPEVYYPRIVLHDHFLWAERLPLGGVHLNRRNPSAPRGFRGSVSRSCHSFAEVEQWRAACDYLFLSPIFPSISKEGYGSGFSRTALEAAAARGVIDSKVIALGGMSGQTIPQLAGLPFGGYALLGAVWGDHLPAGEVVERFRTCQKSICYGYSI